MENTHLAHLREKASSLPVCPGVYLMKNAAGQIIYVGKSRALKNRVTSYFSGRPQSVKTARMVALVRDFDYILCETEIEALALENVLIKKHTPKYNIKLKDAKSYPYLKITNEPFPRLIITRERKSDGGKYFGPYSGMSAAISVKETINRLFSLPVCKRRFPQDIGKERPCLYFQMARCTGPCTGNTDEASYREVIRRAEGVLAGNITATASQLEKDMKAAALEERFEKAAYFRDSLMALRRLSEHQKVVSDESLNADVLAVYENEVTGVLSCLSIRDGKLQSKREFLFDAAEITDDDSLFSFILGYYQDIADVPRTVLLHFGSDAESAKTLADYLSKKAGHRVHIRMPKRGKGRGLCEMAYENAAERARRFEEDSIREDKTLVMLAELLGLDSLPDRIEAYDISNLGREHITASMAVAVRGKHKKSDYRFFRIQGQKEADDYAAMREALSRRLDRIGDGSPSFGEAPDLILLDGGVGHVHAVRPLLRERGLSIPVFGMVKDDFHKTRAITDGEHEIRIIKEQAVYIFIYKLQEEAHRFAVRHMTLAKRKSLRHSVLKDLPGIGEVKIKRLYAAFGSLKRMKNATVKELCTVPGIRLSDATAIFGALHEKENNESTASLAERNDE